MQNAIHRTGYLLMALAVVGVVAGCGVKRETCQVRISYVLQPTQELPEGLKTVAILDAGTKIDGSEDDDRAKKWATIAADGMERMIKDSGAGLTVVERRDMKKVFAEKDLAATGMVQGGQATAAAQLVGAQALITSKLNIRVEVKKSKKTTFDITHVAAAAGHGWGAGSGSLGAREADQISRNMTVQCSFAMLDAATGESLFDYAPRPFRKFDKRTPGAVFGRSSGEGDLDPVDMYIGELVEKGTREFISMFVPVEVEYGYELESNNTENSAAGVRMLRADDYDTAMNYFKAALAEDPNDHRSAFAMGVTAELMGDWHAALKYYRRACAMPGLGEEEQAKYVAAKDRVASQKDRIKKNSNA